MAAPCSVTARSAAAGLLRDDVLRDGAIITTYGTARVINPYFANLAALAIVQMPGGAVAAEKWMRWYVGHLNWPDADDVYGTVDDYTISGDDTEVSLHRADSTDAYAATFLSLARSLFDYGEKPQRSYVTTLKYQLDIIGGVIVKEQQSDGLTWAKPSYRVAYLLDNCEVYRGLMDLSVLMRFAFGDEQAAKFYAGHADLVAQGINTKLWDAAHGHFYIAEMAGGEKVELSRERWFPDWYGQLYPLAQGVVGPADAREQQLYDRLNEAFPHWPDLADDDLGPSGAVGYAAALLGDRGRSERLMAALDSPRSQNRVLRNGAIAERAWLIRVCEAIEADGK